MARPSATAISLVILAALTGCSKPAGGAGASGGPAAATQTASVPVGTACDRKLITQADIAPLLSEPIASMKTLEGDGQSCVFTTSGFSSVTVSLRPGLGDITVQQTLSGATNVGGTPLAGVGDKAVWTPILKEVNATKNDLLCDIQGSGPATGGMTEDKVAALCNKIFAAS
jgi:hypothetical protein